MLLGRPNGSSSKGEGCAAVVILAVVVILVIAIMWGASTFIGMLKDSTEAVYCYRLPETTEYIDGDYVFYSIGDGVIAKAYIFDLRVGCPDSLIHPSLQD